MVGYQDPRMGNQRRKALAAYLKGQGQQRAGAANKMRGINISALGGGRTPGAANPFLRGGSKASPEKFAFAGMKPSLKTLLGLVGQTMGVGGQPSFNIFGPDTPAGGLAWGGAISPTQGTTEGSAPSNFNPNTGLYDPTWGGTVQPNLGGDRVPWPSRATQVGPDGVPTDPYGMPIYQSPGWGQPGFGKPILGDMIYGF